MCLAVPGQIVSIDDSNELLRPSQVKFGPITKEVSLAYTPDAKVGDYVLVHVGFAISVIDESRAMDTIAELERLL